MRIFKNKFTKFQLVLTGVVGIALICGMTGYALHLQSKESQSGSLTDSPKQQTKKYENTSQTKNDAAAPQTATSPDAPPPAPSDSKPVSPAPTTIKTPAPQPVAVNTTNCLPANPSVYQQYYTHMTNSEYLQTNTYIETNKLYDALKYAGLLDVINEKQVVVFAMSDYGFDNLSAAQLAWMNQSPENMRSVLGWQITKSCITWDGLNPVQNASAPITVTTLNGPVTYTPGSPGKLGNASIGMWDWFTSNGSVTITGFIQPPQM